MLGRKGKRTQLTSGRRNAFGLRVHSRQASKQFGELEFQLGILSWRREREGERVSGSSWAEIDRDGVEGGLDLVGMEVEGRNDPGCGEMAGGSEVERVYVWSVCICVCLYKCNGMEEGGRRRRGKSSSC